jgi:hypothetical protein
MTDMTSPPPRPSLSSTTRPVSCENRNGDVRGHFAHLDVAFADEDADDRNVVARDGANAEEHRRSMERLL